jgi:phage host-nuclease inhibitor protein Gam
MDLAMYKKLEREYDKKRLKAQEDARNRKSQLCENIKELGDLLQELNETAIVNAKLMFGMSQEERQQRMETLKQSIMALEEKMYKILEETRISA